jgi:anhydro-N-acetylmuramic acid kinase
MSGSNRIVAGAMSGTSADGVDVALVEIGGGRGPEMTAKLLHHHAQPYEPDLKRRIFAAREAGAVELPELAALGRAISLTYAAAVKAALREDGREPTQIAAVAAHGQTLYHAPPSTIQWLDPALLAAEVGCTVVSDFRRADCAAGGQGAPLVPFADYILFRHPTKNRVLLNIGGIANLTAIPAGAAGIEQLIAFDTGPGNCIGDHICRQRLPDGPGYDVNGDLARQATPLEEAVREFMASAYIRQPPPKSTDGPAMIGLFDECIRRSLRNPSATLTTERLLATAMVITTSTITLAIQLLKPQPHELIISGGGVRNHMLYLSLDEMMAKMNIRMLIADELGVSSAAKEAMAFALLGAATLDGLPANVPSATGAKRAVVLGTVTPMPTAAPTRT